MSNALPTHRDYKVFRVSENANGFGLYGYYLLSADADCWEVARSRGPWNDSVPFNKGDTVKVPLQKVGPDVAGDYRLVPAWHLLSCECPEQKKVLKPYELVRDVWGEEVAVANTRGPTPEPAKEKKYTPSIKFTASQFTGHQDGHYGAADKAKFANQFVRFVERGYKPQDFTKAFYNRLSNCFGHIAHYSQGGFYGHFFESLANKVRFLEQCLAYPCYGQPEYTFCDVEKVLKQWLRAQKVLEQARAAYDAEEQARQLVLRDRLVAKYGPGAVATTAN